MWVKVLLDCKVLWSVRCLHSFQIPWLNRAFISSPGYSHSVLLLLCSTDPAITPGTCQTAHAHIFLWNQTNNSWTGQKVQSDFIVCKACILRKFYTVCPKSLGAVVHMNGVRNINSTNFNKELHLEIQLFSFLLHICSFVKCWVILKLYIFFYSADWSLQILTRKKTGN